MSQSKIPALVAALLVVLVGVGAPALSASGPATEHRSTNWIGQETATLSPTTTEMTAISTDGPPQTPYDASAGEIPGRIEAENFDVGGESVAYHDTDEENRGSVYRDTGVDINSQEDSANVNLGWIRDGEWVEYTVDATGGTYDVQLRVATANPGNELTVRLGDEVLGTTTVPATGGWDTWQTVTIEDVAIPDGDDRVLRLEFSGNDEFLYDLDWLAFTPTGDETATSEAADETATSGATETPTATPGAAETPTSAAEIPLGDRVRGELKRGADANRYTFTAEAGDAIRIASIGGGFADLETRLYGPDGTVLATNDMNYKYRGTHGVIADESGTYTVEVYRAGDDPASESYELRVDTRDPDRVAPYDAAPNDDRSSALSVGSPSENLTAVLATQEDDWYAVTLDRGERLTATLAYRDIELAKGYNVSVAVVAPDGTEVGELGAEASSIYTRGPAPAKSTATQTVVADSAGTYYVRVSGRVGGFVEYGLDLDVSESASKSVSESWSANCPRTPSARVPRTT